MKSSILILLEENSPFMFVKTCGVSMGVSLLTFEQPFSWHTDQPQGPITWPPHSFNLNIFDFLLWEFIEENIYATKYKTVSRANLANWLKWSFHSYCCEVYVWDEKGTLNVLVKKCVSLHYINRYSCWTVM